ncbi:MAG: ABC transporter permease subunit [Chitinispirillaceae bacterium]|nr:ABC transporter permease subunit [Chitinispirillaceae bacterium]
MKNSISIVTTIAINTFKETIRNKILYNILLVAVAALVLSLSFGDMSVFSRAQVLIDFGLATMSLTGLLMAVFIGVGLLGTEISRKTVYGIISKPVNREMFIIGKFVGLLTIMILNFLLIAIIFFVSISIMGVDLKANVVYAVLLLLVEMSVVISASIFFSTFTTPTLAAIFTLGFYVIGHLNNLINIGAEQQSSPVWQALLRTINNILPNLEYFNIRSRVVYDLAITNIFVIEAVLYGILYTILFIIFSTLIFSHKDL